MNSFFKKMLAGFVIGVGGIIPGFSGGILAVSMGLYKPTVDALTGFFKAPGKNFKFLLPLIIGGGIGFLLFMFLLDKLFADYRSYVIFAFVGLVIGSMPSLIAECNEQGYKKHYPLWSVLGFAVAFTLVMLSIFNTGTDVAALSAQEMSAWQCLMCGAIIMSGLLLPGISISFVLILLGVYEGFMHVFTEPVKGFISALSSGAGLGAGFNAVLPYIPKMLFGALGAIAVAVPVLFLVKKVIDKFHGPAYYIIFGIVIATTIGCVIQEILNMNADPEYVFTWWKLLIYIACAGAGALFSLSTEKFMRYKGEEQ